MERKQISKNGTCISAIDMIPLLTLVVLLSPLQAFSQQTVSSSWRKPNITVSRTDRRRRVEALDTTGLFPDPADLYGVSGALYSQLAEFDLATNQRKYAAALEQYFSLAADNLGQYGAENFTGE
ncbi:hypothetical protein B0H14DRAFT_3429328 [Mycena olivaceomarginata]|nr:hypothetical protein B0H14DRAFT_3429328 [Mycena olivaceomarginata]